MNLRQPRPKKITVAINASRTAVRHDVIVARRRTMDLTLAAPQGHSLRPPQLSGCMHWKE